MNRSPKTPRIPLRSLLPILLLLAPALSAAEKPRPEPRQKLSAVSLLPDGSQLHDVMFPRYDENHRLTGVLKAKAMTLVNDKTFSGETVAIEFFNDDLSPRGRADLTRALFNQSTGMLNAKESVIIQSDRINAKGTGLCFAFQQNQGFLLGPVITWLFNPTVTSMNSRPAPLRATAVLGLSLLTQTVTATPPPAVNPQELAAIHAEVTAPTNAASQAAAQARSDLTKDSAEALAASQAANKFIAQAGIPAPTGDAPQPTATKPLEVKPGPNDTVITCDGGMYFDADEGLVVYLKNVHVTDPRFELSGADKLQIFLEKKPAQTPDKTTAKTPKPTQGNPADTLSSGIGNKFGNVDHIVANGAVRIRQKQPEPGKEPIEASGAIFTYHAKTGQIILSGGYPWVKQGTTFLRAEQPNLNLRILKSGSFVTEGHWSMGGNLEKKP